MITPLQSGDPVSRNWRTINEVAAALDAFRLPKNSQDQAIAGLVGRPADIVSSYAFNIYQSDTWLKFKVTAGDLITTGDPITVTNTETEITITTGVARYWFYLNITATTAAVAVSATTLTWDAASKIPIGWVDTNTYSAESRSVIHQREHIFVPCAV